MIKPGSNRGLMAERTFSQGHLLLSSFYRLSISSATLRFFRPATFLNSRSSSPLFVPRFNPSPFQIGCIYDIFPIFFIPMLIVFVCCHVFLCQLIFKFMRVVPLWIIFPGNGGDQFLFGFFHCDLLSANIKSFSVNAKVYILSVICFHCVFQS